MILGIITVIMILGIVTAIVILDIATSIEVLEDLVNSGDRLSVGWQVALLETYCSQDMDTVDIHSTDTLLTVTRHMAINRTDIMIPTKNKTR